MCASLYYGRGALLSHGLLLRLILPYCLWEARFAAVNWRLFLESSCADGPHTFGLMVPDTGTLPVRSTRLWRLQYHSDSMRCIYPVALSTCLLV